MAMERLLQSMKQKLRRMRLEQREQQRIIDEQNDNYARTSYCKLCKLNYKQSRQEHYTSDFHIVSRILRFSVLLRLDQMITNFESLI